MADDHDRKEEDRPGEPPRFAARWGRVGRALGARWLVEPVSGGSDWGAHHLPRRLLPYVFQTSGVHQAVLALLAVAVFMLGLAPLELQRRIVNSLVEGRAYRHIIIFCILYAGLALCEGATKIGLNIYRAWLSERAARDLRRTIRANLARPTGLTHGSAEEGLEVSMVVAEVDPIAGFVGEGLSEPLLQAGILLSHAGYMIFLDRWMALLAFAVFVPQLIIVPLMQHAMNLRSEGRVRALREVSIGIVAAPGHGVRPDDLARTQRVFELNMEFFRIKFSLNFLMNVIHQFGLVGSLMLGAYFVQAGRIEIGTVVAFLAAQNQLSEPWGLLVDYFRDLITADIKFRLVADTINEFATAPAEDSIA